VQSRWCASKRVGVCRRGGGGPCQSLDIHTFVLPLLLMPPPVPPRNDIPGSLLMKTAWVGGRQVGQASAHG
jgi:hypothetical protein